MEKWIPTPQQEHEWAAAGYFILRQVIPYETALEVRGVIKDEILRPEGSSAGDKDPMDPMGDSPQARAARYRKLNNFCVRSPLIMHQVHGSEALLRIVRHFLGDNLLLKFNSCFLKPARTGSATPWHQDNGLWRDGQTEPFNFWMALDPAVRENGCMQFIPGSHRGPIVPHVRYPDSIHGELPRPLVRERLAADEVRHIELQPGDAVFWHSSLWHYSPPNTSEHSRIAIAGVYTTPALADAGRHFWGPIPWVLREGQPERQFPFETYRPPAPHQPQPPFPAAE